MNRDDILSSRPVSEDIMAASNMVMQITEMSSDSSEISERDRGTRLA